MKAGLAATSALRTGSIPCAIYTRKSSEEGLEQDFNSLDAQREACAAYILSQKALGWVARRDTYDDGGFSGGSTERPALQRLLADIGGGLVKVVVVYKVDRLTRSLADFAKMVELFDEKGVSFVSVTQQFNTTTSMGRLTLNVLLSFAQFEREVTGERIRDKIAASKKKGMWMGGMCPVGYLPHERTLVIDEPQAIRIRGIFALYLQLDNVRAVQNELKMRNWLTPERQSKRAGQGGNRPFSRGHLYRILRNPIYIGRISHKGEVYEGNHPPIIDVDLWDQVQERLEANRQGEKVRVRAVSKNLLAGLLFDEAGNRFTGTHSQKGSKRYRYYVQQAGEDDPDAGTADQVMRIPAQDLEGVVIQTLVDFLWDAQQVADLVPDDADEKRLAIDQAARLAGAIKASDIESIHQVIKAITVTEHQLSIDLKTEWATTMETEQTLKADIELRKSGKTMKLILPSSKATPSKPDPKLIRLIARGFDWAMQLTSGKVKTIGEIAKAEGVTPTYVTRIMQFGFMAPDLMQQVIRGQQPPKLTAHSIIQLGALPIDWGDQARHLGMD